MLDIYNADKESEKLIKKVYKAALKYFSQKDIFEVEIEIVDKDEIQSDFPLDVDPDSGKLLLGETVMCMDKILEQSDEFGTTPEREAGYLFLHSLLHLFGYDHMEDDEKAEMREKEEEILKTIGLSR